MKLFVYIVASIFWVVAYIFLMAEILLPMWQVVAIKLASAITLVVSTRVMLLTKVIDVDKGED